MVTMSAHRVSESGTTIGVVGTGYVGLVSAVGLADLGHHVIAVDIDERRRAAIAAGDPPIHEAGLEDLLRSVLAAGRLTVTHDHQELGAADVVLLCVPTPAAEDGRADLRALETAVGQLRDVLAPGTLLATKSTVPVGTAARVRALLGRDDVAVVSNPEFLREGVAVADFLQPSRVVIGADDSVSGRRLATIYDGLDAPVVITDTRSAELVKLASNTLLALRLTFVNDLAALCDASGADIAEVTRGMAGDERIGPAFLQPGPGWGGSCFPKDTRSLLQIARDHGIPFDMLDRAIHSNERQRWRAVDRIRNALSAPLHGSRVAVWGVAFKAGTDDVRDSPAVPIIEDMLDEGATVVAYDPEATAVPTGAERAPSAVAAAVDADVLVVLTEWADFAKVDPLSLAAVMRGRVVVDLRNLLDTEPFLAAGFTVHRNGRPTLTPQA